MMTTTIRSGPGPCPPATDIAAWLDGTLHPIARGIVAEHLTACVPCRRTAAEATAVQHDPLDDALWMPGRQLLAVRGRTYVVLTPEEVERLRGREPHRLVYIPDAEWYRGGSWCVEA